MDAFSTVSGGSSSPTIDNGFLQRVHIVCVAAAEHASFGLQPHIPGILLTITHSRVFTSTPIW